VGAWWVPCVLLRLKLAVVRQVFTSIALLNNLTGPLINFPYIINAVLEAYVSVRRLQRFLRIPSPPLPPPSPSPPPTPSSTPSPCPPCRPPQEQEELGESGEETTKETTPAELRTPSAYTFQGGTFAVSGPPGSGQAVAPGDVLEGARGGAASVGSGDRCKEGMSDWRLHIPDLVVPAGAVVAVTGEVRDQDQGTAEASDQSVFALRAALSCRRRRACEWCTTGTPRRRNPCYVCGAVRLGTSLCSLAAGGLWQVLPSCWLCWGSSGGAPPVRLQQPRPDDFAIGSGSGNGTALGSVPTAAALQASETHSHTAGTWVRRRIRRLARDSKGSTLH